MQLVDVDVTQLPYGRLNKPTLLMPLHGLRSFLKPKTKQAEVVQPPFFKFPEMGRILKLFSVVEIHPINTLTPTVHQLVTKLVLVCYERAAKPTKPFGKQKRNSDRWKVSFPRIAAW